MSGNWDGTYSDIGSDARFSLFHVLDDERVSMSRCRRARLVKNNASTTVAETNFYLRQPASFGRDHEGEPHQGRELDRGLDVREAPRGAYTTYGLVGVQPPTHAARQLTFAVRDERTADPDNHDQCARTRHQGRSTTTRKARRSASIDPHGLVRPATIRSTSSAALTGGEAARSSAAPSTLRHQQDSTPTPTPSRTSVQTSAPTSRPRRPRDRLRVSRWPRAHDSKSADKRAGTACLR